jgi:hypothetical protein
LDGDLVSVGFEDGDNENENEIGETINAQGSDESWLKKITGKQEIV